jgi:undecaprenyl-diphosphatase
MVFVAAAWLAVLGVRPAARRIGASAAARRAATRLAAGRDWVVARVAAQLLVLIAGASVVVALGAVFAEVTEAVMDQDDLTVLDRPVLAWLAAHRTPAMTQAQIGITNLGGAVTLTVLLTATAALVAVRLRSWRPVVLTAIAAGGIQLLVFAIKTFIARPRPLPSGRLVEAGGFSYPSGHSASAVVCFGMLAWLVCLLTTRAQIRATAWLAAGLLTIAVGLSRAYLGVHYPSDIIGGWILGAAWLATVAAAAYATARRPAKSLPGKVSGQQTSTG